MNMNAVGIDVSKGKSMVAILLPYGEIVSSPFEIKHASGNIQSLNDFGDNSLRKVKSDKADAVKIARYTLDS